MSVYTLAANILALRDRLGDMETDEVPDDLVQTLVLAENDVVKAVEDVAKLIKNSEYQEASLRQEANLLTFQARREETIQKRLKDQLKVLFKALDVNSIDAKIFTVSVRDSPTPAVVIEDEYNLNLDEFPPEFVKIEKSLVKSKLREAIEKGNEVPAGITLRRDKYVNIRTIRTI